MSYHCKAPRDCGCTLWDFGKVNPICIEEDCLDLVETYDFRTCDCGTKDKPVLYGEGVARVYVEAKGEESCPYFRDFDGYVVECDECGAVTRCYGTPEKAVEAWNNKNLVYAGYMRK